MDIINCVCEYLTFVMCFFFLLRIMDAIIRENNSQIRAVSIFLWFQFFFIDSTQIPHILYCGILYIEAPYYIYYSHGRYDYASEGYGNPCILYICTVMLVAWYCTFNIPHTCPRTVCRLKLSQPPYQITPTSSAGYRKLFCVIRLRSHQPCLDEVTVFVRLDPVTILLCVNLCPQLLKVFSRISSEIRVTKIDGRVKPHKNVVKMSRQARMNTALQCTSYKVWYFLP